MALRGYTFSGEEYNHMAKVNTAISVPKTLFEQAEALAREMKVSRSGLFAVALENFIRDYEDRQMFDKINKAYADAPPDEAERSRLRHISRQHRRIVEGKYGIE